MTERASRLLPAFRPLLPPLHVGAAENHLLQARREKRGGFGGAGLVQGVQLLGAELDFQRGQVIGHLRRFAGPDEGTRDARPGQRPGQGYLGRGADPAGRLPRAKRRESASCGP